MKLVERRRQPVIIKRDICSFRKRTPRRNAVSGSVSVSIPAFDNGVVLIPKAKKEYPNAAVTRPKWIATRMLLGSIIHCILRDTRSGDAKSPPVKRTTAMVSTGSLKFLTLLIKTFEMVPQELAHTARKMPRGFNNSESLPR